MMRDGQGIFEVLLDPPSELAGNKIERIQNLDDCSSFFKDCRGTIPVSRRERNHTPMIDIITKIKLDSLLLKMEDQCLKKIRVAGNFRINIQRPARKPVQLHRNASNDNKSERNIFLLGKHQALVERGNVSEGQMILCHESPFRKI